MAYSEKLNEIIKKAETMARDMGSKRVCTEHILAAAIDLNYVEKSIKASGVDVKKMKDLVKKSCEKCEKLSPATIERFKNHEEHGYERSLKLDFQAQKIMAFARNLSEQEEIWKTGEVELTHLMMAILGTNIVPDFTNIMGYADNDGAKINTFINEIAKYEAKEHGVEAPVISISLNNASENKKARVTEGRETNNRTVNTNEFSTDLLAIAREDDKPFIGREKEIASLMQCLERRDKPNAILAGAPGVGKTDIVRGLAKKIVNGEVPEQLKDVNLLLIDVPGMVAGSEFRGMFEKRLKATLEMACKMERPILFIDEIHTVLGAGASSGGSMDAANILKPYLTEGKIRVIGATTTDEYRQHVEKDAAFMRRFQKIDVTEPSAKEAVEILCGVKEAYETFHNVKLTKETIKTAVDLSVRYMHDKFLPDKAIDVMDQTCARVKLNGEKKITVADIEETVSALCHIPATTVQKDELSKVRTLDKKLKEQVFGQEEAIDKITEAVQMSKAGLNDENKPIGTFLFVGPSGVGKTEIAKQLAANLGIDFIRFDMSEYGESHSVAKLIGSPAGYVGYEDGGLLVESVRQKPHAVLLFDEIEKAHSDIYKIFLQIFDYGMLSDNKGRKADFRNTIIIMTSNAGNAVAEKSAIGFGGMLMDNKIAKRVDASMKAIAEIMPPELRGRISATVVFNPLNNDVSKLIVQKELKKLTLKLKVKGTNVKYTDATIDKLVEMGVSTQYGAREIQRVIDNEIKKMFVKQIISGKNKGDCTVDVVDGKFAILSDKKTSTNNVKVVRETV